MRIAVLGNAGSGKSTLSAQLARDHDLPLHEMDRLMWQPGWAPVPPAEYEAAHADILAQPRWVIDGMGRKGSLPTRLERASHIVLCDFPIWQNFWLLSQRQANWMAGREDTRPGGQDQPPETRDLFAFVWNVHENFMPDLRQMIDAVDDGARVVVRLADFDALTAFKGFGAPPDAGS